MHTICSDDDMISDYNGLFDKGYEDMDDLQSQFNEAFGQSFAMMDPTMLDLVNQAHISTLSGPDLEPRRDICSGEAFASAMTLDQIITSCFFAMVQSACGDEAEEDASFSYELENTQFELPLVRWSYDVSPPPPPPMEMAAYQELVDDDQEGFIEVKRRIEGFFPALKHVATSSMGASIAGHIADFTVTPMQLTRAFLASRGMETDSLGARVIESRHTGRWRFACKEMHHFFRDYVSPGRNSEAYRAGAETQHSTHSGKWDRNPFVAAMLEIKLSMTGHAIDQTKFDALGMWDRICGGAPSVAITDKDHTGNGPAGYRVPTNSEWDSNFDTYGDGDVPITEFSPIVAYGSLEMLRSMRSADFHTCPQGLYESDGLAWQYCENNQEYLVDEMLRRSEYSPFRLQRDIWCDPHKHLSIEQSVGAPEYFDEDVYDTEVKDRFRINNLILLARQRGEENIADKSWVKRSLMSWVYVTSSSDRNIRAGMHRLLDLAVFREQSCDTLPSVQCSLGTEFTSVEVPIPADAPPYYREMWRQQNYYYRQERTDAVVRINAELSLVDGLGSASAWRNGRDALPMYRCNSMVAAYLGSDPCEHVPYQSPTRAQCSTYDLTLQSRPTIYGSKHWLSRLGIVPSPSPPPPPPNPHPPPAPPSPHPPPLPPYRYSQNEVMAAIRKAEERVCTSVYYLSMTTRCERLAQDLTVRWLMEFTSPPLIPPLSITSPSPPPLAPPSPALPSGFAYVATYGATMSTFRLSTQLPAGETMDTHGFYTADQAALKATLATTDQMLRACLPGAPLPCASGSLMESCLNGGRRCTTNAENAENPWAEIRFKLTDRAYLWGIKVTLPRNEQLANLFVGTKRIEMWGIRDEPLPCAEGNNEVVGVPEGYEVTIVCHPPTATDAQLYALAGAYRIRITLTGTFRQVWFENVQAMERPLLEVPGVFPAPSPPPPTPGHPPDAPPPPGTASPPPVACTFYPNTWLDPSVSHRLEHEPCGLTQEECCLHKQENGASAYQIDDAGCCDLIHLDGGLALSGVTVGADALRHGAYATRSGTGE